MEHLRSQAGATGQRLANRPGAETAKLGGSATPRTLGNLQAATSKEGVDPPPALCAGRQKGAELQAFDPLE